MKIFSDMGYLAGQEHFVILYPFWGKNPEDKRDPSSGRFDRYVEIGSRFFQMTTLAEADVAVLPMAWELVLKSEAAMNLAMQFVEAASKAGKRVVVFFKNMCGIWWKVTISSVPGERVISHTGYTKPLAVVAFLFLSIPIVFYRINRKSSGKNIAFG